MPGGAAQCRAAAGAGGIWAAIRRRELFSQTNSTTRRTPDDATGTVGGLFFGFNSVIWGRIRRERAYIDPMDAAEAYFNLRPYLEKPGLVYVHMRRNAAMFGSIPTRPAGEEVDWVDVKPGRATDLAARRESYADKCVGVELAWQYCYETKYSVLLERLVHLTLTARGAKRQPEECEGCGVWHREYFGEGAAGGLDGVAGIIEYWMRRLGEVPGAKYVVEPGSVRVVVSEFWEIDGDDAVLSNFDGDFYQTSQGIPGEVGQGTTRLKLLLP
ncbi:hypothetical protein B0H11DRAFT_1930557 [Mycena galericulata]|nr:hypothetical protein B0H11DRAFT_1930557 [Mycena galericulata]